MHPNRVKTNTCPVCSSDVIEGARVHVGEFGASQTCSCTECNAEWHLIFEAVEKLIIEEPKT